MPGTPIIRKKLEEGIMGEANMDGTIYINENIVPGSFQDRQTINHEMRHATDIKIGKLEYGDDYIKYNGITYPRQDINGIDAIEILTSIGLNGKITSQRTNGFLSAAQTLKERIK